MKHKYDNTVIKALTKEHGAEVIQWWKKQGVDTTGYTGICNEECRYDDIYYGLINGSFSNYSLQQMKDYNAKIIELPVELPSRGDKILVWDDDENTVTTRIFLAYIEGLRYPVICVTLYSEDKFEKGDLFNFESYKYWKPILKQQKIVEVTPQEIAKLMGVNVEQLRIKG